MKKGFVIGKKEGVFMERIRALLVMVVLAVSLSTLFAGQVVLKDDFSDGDFISNPTWKAHTVDNRFAVVDDQGRKAMRALERSSAGTLFRIPPSIGEPVVLDTRQGPISVKFEMRFGSAERKNNWVTLQLRGPKGHVDPRFVQGGRVFLRQEVVGGGFKNFVSKKAYYFDPNRYYAVELICHQDGSFEILIDGKRALLATPQSPLRLFGKIVLFEPGRAGKTHYFTNIVVNGTPKAEKVSYFRPGETPLLTIPRAAVAPRIDGNIEPGEWEQAGGVTGFFDLNGALADKQTIVYTTFDDKNLYIAFSSLNRAKDFRPGKSGRDIKFGAQMEAVEVWIQPPGKGWFQFLGVPAGGIIDANSREGASWNGKWEFKSQVKDSGEVISGVLSFDKKIWTVEIAIPFETLGVSAPKDGEVWRMNFCRDISGETERTPKGWTSWAFTQGKFANPAKFGYVKFKQEAVGFQLRQVGDLGSGNIAIKGSVAGKDREEIAVEMAVKTRDKKGRILLKRLKKIDLSPGKVKEFSLPATLKVSGRTDAELILAAQDISKNMLLAQSEIPFTVLSSFQLDCVLNYKEKMLYVDVDAQRLANLPGNLSARVEIYKAGEAGVELSAPVKGLSAKSPKSLVKVDVSALPVGEYLVKGIIRDASGKVLASTSEPLTIPEKPSWMGNKIGISEKVPPPWFPVKVKGNRVEVTEREYIIGNNGLPISIKALGKDILASPAVLRAVVNGKEVSWKFSPLKKIEQKDGEVTWELAGKGGPLTLSGKLRIEFDGFALWDVKISSKQAVTIDSLSLEFPINKERALYARGTSRIPIARVCSASLYKDVFTEDSSRKVEEIVGGSQWRYSRKGWIWNDTFFYNLWVGDDKRGFSVMTESDKNVRSKKYQEITPQGKRVTLKLNLIGEPTRLNKPLSYQYMYQATPVKPRPKNPRLWHTNYGASGWPPPEGMLKRVYITLYAYGDLAKVSYPEVKNPAATRRKAAIVHAKGAKMVTYFATSGASIDTPEFKLFGKEWEVLPRRDAFGGAVRIVSAQSSYSDFILYALKKIVEDFDLDGFYLDVSGAVADANPAHGAGYQRAGENQRHPTMAYLATRELYKRMYTYLHTGGRNGVIFQHQMPPALYAGFVDLTVEGESWGGEGKNRYTRLTPDMFRAKEMKIQYGTPYLWYDFFQVRVSRKDGPISLGESLAVTLPFYVLPSLGGPRIFPYWDLLDKWWTTAEFIPYWAKGKAVSTDNKLVLASTYLKPEEKKALIVVANWNYSPVQSEVTLDFNRLGISARKAKVVDAMSGKPVKRKGARILLNIPKRDVKFLLVE